MNFTKAAEELNISQSAVSQQMRTLTRRLHFPLFRKQSNKLLLTYEGDRLSKVVSKAIYEIENEISLLSVHDSIGDLRIGVDPSFAIGWLLPKLDRFEARLMDSQVMLNGNNHRLRVSNDKEDDGVDISIQILTTAPEIVSFYEIPNDDFIAICSPELLYRGASEMSIKEFRNESLLTLSPHGVNAAYSMDCMVWSESAEVGGIPARDHEQYSSLEMLMQAVVHCRGIAIIRQSLADDHLRANRVVRALPHAVRCTDSYYVTWMENSQNIKHIREFIEWFSVEFEPSSMDS